jgi:hypothetical protein
MQQLLGLQHHAGQPCMKAVGSKWDYVGDDDASKGTMVCRHDGLLRDVIAAW